MLYKTIVAILITTVTPLAWGARYSKKDCSPIEGSFRDQIIIDLNAGIA